MSNGSNILAITVQINFVTAVDNRYIKRVTAWKQFLSNTF